MSKVGAVYTIFRLAISILYQALIKQFLLELYIYVKKITDGNYIHFKIVKRKINSAR